MHHFTNVSNNFIEQHWKKKHLKNSIEFCVYHHFTVDGLNVLVIYELIQTETSIK